MLTFVLREIKVLKALDGDFGMIERDALVEDHFYTKLDAKEDKSLYTLNLIHEPLSEEIRARLAREGTLTLGGTADFRNLGDGALAELQNEERLRRENANKRKRDSSAGVVTSILSIEKDASAPQEVQYTASKRQRTDGAGGQIPSRARPSSVQLTHAQSSQGMAWVVPKTEDPRLKFYHQSIPTTLPRLRREQLQMRKLRPRRFRGSLRRLNASSNPWQASPRSSTTANRSSDPLIRLRALSSVGEIHSIHKVFPTTCQSVTSGRRAWEKGNPKAQFALVNQPDLRPTSALRPQ